MPLVGGGELEGGSVSCSFEPVEGVGAEIDADDWGGGQYPYDIGDMEGYCHSQGYGNIEHFRFGTCRWLEVFAGGVNWAGDWPLALAFWNQNNGESGGRSMETWSGLSHKTKKLTLTIARAQTSALGKLMTKFS